MIHPNVNAPLVGTGELMEIEKDPIKIDHIPEQRAENKAYEIIEETKELNCMPVDGNVVRFTFFDQDIIKPDSIAIHFGILNTNNNYLQLDSSPSSLISRVRWLYKGKILEDIEDYNIITNFLFDMEYSRQEKNVISELQKPLTVSSKEELICPKMPGTHSIFNPFIHNYPYIECREIKNGQVYMDEVNYKEFSVRLFSFIFNNPQEKLLNLETFPNLELEITLNKYAFFVPVFNATVSDLVGISSSAKIAELSGNPQLTDFDQLLLSNAQTFKNLDLRGYQIDPYLAINMLLSSIYINLDLKVSQRDVRLSLAKFEKDLLVYKIALSCFIGKNNKKKMINPSNSILFYSLYTIQSKNPDKDLLDVLFDLTQSNYYKQILLALKLSSSFSDINRLPSVLTSITNLQLNPNTCLQSMTEYLNTKLIGGQNIVLLDFNKDETYLLDNNFNFYYCLPDQSVAINLNNGLQIQLGQKNEDGTALYTVDDTKKFRPETVSYQTIVNHFNSFYNENIFILKTMKDIFMFTNETQYECFNIELLRLYYTLTNLNQLHSKIIIKDLISSKLQTIYKDYFNVKLPSFVTLFDRFKSFVKINNSKISSKQSILRQSSLEYQELNEIVNKTKLSLSRNFDVIKCFLTYKHYKKSSGLKIAIPRGWKTVSYFYKKLEKREFYQVPPQKIYIETTPNTLRKIYHLIYNKAYIKYPTYRALNRYNRHIRNMWIEVNGRKLPKEILKKSSANSDENTLFNRLSKCFIIQNSAINIQNFSIDNNTQLYVTMKLNGYNNSLINFGQTINFDKFIFGYENEIISKAIFGFNLDSLRNGLTAEVNNSISFDKFEVHFENDIVQQIDSVIQDFDLFEMFTYGEYIVTFEFDSNGFVVSRSVVPKSTIPNSQLSHL